MYFVLGIIMYVFTLVFGLVIGAAVGGGLAGQLLQTLLTLVLFPLWLVPYAVSYFDLTVRSDGAGLERLIQSTVYGGGAGAPYGDREPADPFGVSRGEGEQARPVEDSYRERQLERPLSDSLGDSPNGRPGEPEAEPERKDGREPEAGRRPDEEK
ncbi:hypothetical protein N6H14_02730 [Paenibacillus sp. CC-CFT747]|nr:hypothetical protein N6H14_02730 [Paenibacillus sp. CC-CFT747]